MSILSAIKSIGSPSEFHIPQDVFYKASIALTINAYQAMYGTIRPKLDWEEDTFTLQLKHYIRKQISEKLMPIEVEAHVKVHTTEMLEGNVSVKQASEIDLKLYRPFDQNSDNFYFAWECKLIGEKNKDLAWRYVVNGIIRFVKGDYSSQQIMAGMIGYVLDSDVTSLTNKINSSILRSKRNYKFTSTDQLLKIDPIENFSEVYISQHKRLAVSQEISLHHLFMTFIWEDDT